MTDGEGAPQSGVSDKEATQDGDARRGTTVLLCECSVSGAVPEDVLSAASDRLSKEGVCLVRTNDLCGLAATGRPRLNALATTSTLVVVACRPRVVRWLLTWARGAGPDERVEALGLRDLSAADIDRAISERLRARGDSLGGGSRLDATEDGWVPWFPVIDYGRCRNCGQCLNFCLFGVYERSEEGRVQVANPRNCKNNCPACARICPEAAIMFPKLGEAPIDGAEITDEDEIRARIKLNVNELLGDDVYRALAERRRRAKGRLLRKHQIEQAERERAACKDSG